MQQGSSLLLSKRAAAHLVCAPGLGPQVHARHPAAAAATAAVGRRCIRHCSEEADRAAALQGEVNETLTLQVARHERHIPECVVSTGYAVRQGFNRFVSANAKGSM